MKEAQSCGEGGVRPAVRLRAPWGSWEGFTEEASDSESVAMGAAPARLRAPWSSGKGLSCGKEASDPESVATGAVRSAGVWLRGRRRLVSSTSSLTFDKFATRRRHLKGPLLWASQMQVSGYLSHCASLILKAQNFDDIYIHGWKYLGTTVQGLLRISLRTLILHGPSRL